jgi:acyl carrier protein
MGFDSVELVMKVEETFDVAIENSEAEKISTPGLLIDLVMSKVGRTSHAVCLTQRAFHRVRGCLIRQSGFRRGQIRLESVLTDLFRLPTRKESVPKILADIGVRKQIQFVRPAWLDRLIWTAMFSAGIATCICLAWHPIASKSTKINFVFGSPIGAGILVFAITGWISYSATRPMCDEFPPSMKTVGHLSRWIAANAPHVVEAPPGQWSREQVSEIIREIVVETLGCEKEYREDAHFVKDLGLS